MSLVFWQRFPGGPGFVFESPLKEATNWARGPLSSLRTDLRRRLPSVTSPTTNAEPAAPAGPAPEWTTSASFDDIDQQAAQLRGYGQHYEQLSCGRFQGRFASYYLRDCVSIHFERINCTLFQSALSPAGHYTAVFLAENSPPAILNGAVFSPTEFELWPPSHIFEGVMPSGMEVCVVSLPCRFVSPADGAGLTARRIRDPQAVGHLRGFINGSLAEFRRRGAMLPQAPAMEQFAAAIGGLFVGAVNDPSATSSHGIPIAHKTRSYRRVRDLIHQNLPTGVSVASICIRAGLSRRALEYLFESTLGVSPARYIRVLQLNGVRRALLAQENAQDSIGDIAARYGIWHWSRFSAAYRRMFGELPSETRRNLPR